MAMELRPCRRLSLQMSSRMSLLQKSLRWAQLAEKGCPQNTANLNLPCKLNVCKSVHSTLEYFGTIGCVMCKVRTCKVQIDAHNCPYLLTAAMKSLGSLPALVSTQPVRPWPLWNPGVNSTFQPRFLKTKLLNAALKKPKFHPYALFKVINDCMQLTASKSKRFCP